MGDGRSITVEEGWTEKGTEDVGVPLTAFSSKIEKRTGQEYNSLSCSVQTSLVITDAKE